MSSEHVTIKKYENRRLYDTRASCYVNLEGVADLVREGCEIQVLDAKTGDDITRQVLTQIIVDRSRDPDRGLPLDFLRDLVRASDRAQKDFLRWYLSAAGEVYKQFQAAWTRGAKPPGAAELRKRWEEWVGTWLPGASGSPFLGVWGHGSRHDDASTESGEDDADRSGERIAGDTVSKGEVAELRKRLEELERRLEGEG